MLCYRTVFLCLDWTPRDQNHGAMREGGPTSFGLHAFTCCGPPTEKQWQKRRGSFDQILTMSPRPGDSEAWGQVPSARKQGCRIDSQITPQNARMRYVWVTFFLKKGNLYIPASTVQPSFAAPVSKGECRAEAAVGPRVAVCPGPQPSLLMFL